MRGTPSRLLFVATVLAALTGCCPPAFTIGENGELAISDNLTFTRRCGAPLDVPILVGTRLCGTLRCAEEEDCPEEGDVGDCFMSSVEGPASPATDGHCLVVEGAGEIRWHHEPATCEAREALGYDGGADTFTFEGIAADGLHAFDYYPSEELLYAFVGAETTTESGRYVAEPRLPDDFLPAPGEERRVFVGEVFAFTTGLDVEGAPVAWNPDEATLDAVDDASAQATLEVVLDQASAPRVRLVDDDVATVRLHLHDITLPLTRLKGVRAEDVADLSLHVVWQDAAGPTPAVPIILYADVRDRDREVVRAAPVEWEVLEGDLALSPTESVAGDDAPRAVWVSLEDVCLPPSQRTGERRVRVRASVAELSEKVELSWTVPSPSETEDGASPPSAPVSDEGFRRDPRCPKPGCSCSATGRDGARGTGFATLAALLLLVGARGGARGGRR